MPSLRRRVVAACLVASSLVLVAVLGILVSIAEPGALSATTVGVALGTVLVLGTALSFGLSILAVRSSASSLERIASWAAHLASRPSSAQRPPAVVADFTDLISAVGELTAGLLARVEGAEADRQRLGAVIARMGSGVLMLDDHERIELINLAAAQLLETTVPRAEGQRLVDVARDHELVAIARDSLKPGPGAPGAGRPTVIELVPSHKHVQVIANTLGTSTGDRRVLLLLQDVTQLTETDTIRREFVANVSHELRTPIAGLKALAETLEAGALDDPPAARAFVAQMVLEVDRLAQLVEELLELAQLESGKLTLTEESVDLYAVAQRAANRLEARVERSGVALRVAAPDRELAVLGDETRLERVFVNLIDNAIKFTPATGSITLSFEVSEGSVVASVADTGVGIPSRDLTRVFERFYKSDKARASGGSGLGLAIAKHTVQAHHGQIWATSREGEGTTFFVSLPLAG